VRYDPAAFGYAPLTINLHVTDLDEHHVLGIGRSAIHHRAGAVDSGADAVLRIDRASLIRLLANTSTADGLDIDGNAEAVQQFFRTLTVFTSPALIEP